MCRVVGRLAWLAQGRGSQEQPRPGGEFMTGRREELTGASIVKHKDDSVFVFLGILCQSRGTVLGLEALT